MFLYACANIGARECVIVCVCVHVHADVCMMHFIFVCRCQRFSRLLEYVHFLFALRLGVFVCLRIYRCSCVFTQLIFLFLTGRRKQRVCWVLVRMTKRPSRFISRRVSNSSLSQRCWLLQRAHIHARTHTHARLTKHHLKRGKVRTHFFMRDNQGPIKWCFVAFVNASHRKWIHQHEFKCNHNTN